MRFSDIPAHDDIKQRLTQLADTDRIPHALLLSGPAGSGKLALARAFAQYIHCPNRRNGDSCGVCPTCKQHQSVNFPDMHYVFPVLKKAGKKISTDYIDQWREFMADHPFASFSHWLDIIDAGNSQPAIYAEESTAILHNMNLSNFSAKYKIMIVWLPEKIVEAAANKLLKIIEEPFADTKFIFVSNEPQNILPTIFSRTQQISVPSMSIPELAGYLSSSFNIDFDQASECAALSEGNVSKAIDSITYTSENNEFLDTFKSIMRMAYARDMRGLKDNSEIIAGYGREKARRFLAYSTHMLRENFINNLHDSQLLSMNSDETTFSSRFSPFINTRNIGRLMELFDAAYNDIGRNANAKIVMFDTLIQLALLIKL